MTLGWKAKVKQEKKVLDSELESLSTFLLSDAFGELPAKQRTLLRRQHSHMRSLSEILGLRLGQKVSDAILN